MKKIFFLALGISLLGCSSEEVDNPEPKPEPVVENPVAVDDFVEATEDEELVIANLTDNDDLKDNARITSFDNSTEEGGSISDNRDGTYTYTPTADFVGTDSFTYTICGTSDSSNCSTATVEIEVKDAGSPQANDDEVNTTVNASLSLGELAANDDISDEASIISVDDSQTSGSVSLGEDGVVSYTPPADFEGQDTFTYSLCDDDSPEATCSTATVTVNVLNQVSFSSVPADLQDYYSDLQVTTAGDLNYEFIAEHTRENHTTILFYGERHDFLYEADEDLDNPDNVILMYSGESRYWEEYTSGTNSYSPQTYNTEHIYPQSMLSSDDAVTDLHHLRATDADVNSLRLNYPYTEGSGDYGLVGDEAWYPGDEWKGDVARMIFYLNVRYGEEFVKVGNLELFLKWNREDPVSAFELQRNNVIQGAQGNRNPFIDNPYLATLIWGGEAAENTWD